jgi:hypothetical protein
VQALEHQYGIQTVLVETHDEGCAAAANGTACTAYAFDAGRPKLCQEEGLVQAAGIPPLMTAPFAFSVNKNSTALARRISAALVETMRVRGCVDQQPDERKATWLARACGSENPPDQH